MNFKSILIITAAAAMLTLPSCHKKDDDETSYPYLDGTLSFSIPTYVLKGVTFTLTPKGVSNPTGNVGYSWYASWKAKKDTTKKENATGDGSWTIAVPDSIGMFLVTGTAFAENYSPLSSSKTIYVVDPTVDATVTGAGYQVDSASFKDPRDGGVYYLTKAGDQVWMQNNLYYTESGVSFDYSPAIDPIFGRLYTWEEAMKACPDGWHLPSDAEFGKLAGYAVGGSAFPAGETFTAAAGPLMANAFFIGDKMWTYWPQVPITNKTKFSALPVGYGIDQIDSQKYMGLKSYSVFWTSGESEGKGVYRYIYVDKNDIFAASGDEKSFRATVRCVKD